MVSLHFFFTSEFKKDADKPSKQPQCGSFSHPWLRCSQALTVYKLSEDKPFLPEYGAFYNVSCGNCPNLCSLTTGRAQTVFEWHLYKDESYSSC